MDLRTYLDQPGVTASALAAKIGVAHTTVIRWADRTLKPEPGRIPAIVAATDGRVTAAELRPDLAHLFKESA